MKPAVTRGLWIATASGGAILIAGLAAVHRLSHVPQDSSR
jgi:hypothetical protein